MELYNRCAKSPATATRGLTAQAFDAAALEALYFVLALVDDDHEAKQSAELSKRMREAAPPRLPRMKARRMKPRLPCTKARLPCMKARPAPRVQIRACSRLCLALPVGASERASGLVVA